MKAFKIMLSLALVFTIVGSTACSAKEGTGKLPDPNEVEIVTQQETSQSSAVAEEEYETIQNYETPLSEILLMEDATEVVEIDNGFSFISAQSFETSVAFYQSAVVQLGVEGGETAVDAEELGVEQIWKYDGSLDERIFNVTVAQSASGQIGVAIVY